MSTPTFSLLHSTYGRPQKAAAAMRMWFDRARNPEAVEYIFACNEDDPSVPPLLRDTRAERHRRYVHFTMRQFQGSAPAWDHAASISTGAILIQAQDDVEPPQEWDRRILDEIAIVLPSVRPVAGVDGILHDPPAFIAVSDGYRKDALCCTAIMNRARYEQCGEFLHPGYRSVFSDDEVTIRAIADGLDGKCTFIDARDLVFRHEHCYHNPAVPNDSTYARENSAEAYRIGSELFAARNAHLIARGLRTWG